MDANRHAGQGWSLSSSPKGNGTQASLTAYVLELGPGRGCFCCSADLVIMGRGAASEVACPDCGAGVDEPEEGVPEARLNLGRAA
jgi:hypothetical protein